MANDDGYFVEVKSIGDIFKNIGLAILFPFALPFALLLEGDKIILLDGKTGSGKDTLINILQGNGFIKEPNPTTQAEIINIDNLKIGISDIHNVSGVDSEEGIKKREEKRKEIFAAKIKNKNNEEIKNPLADKEIIFAYLLDATDMKDEKKKKSIMLRLKCLKKEIDEANKKRDKPIIFKVIGTRGDLITRVQKNSMEKHIKETLLTECEIFNMIRNPRKKLIDFILGKQQ